MLNFAIFKGRYWWRSINGARLGPSNQSRES